MEEKKELLEKELKEEELDKVAGGELKTYFFIQYKCNKCTHTWLSQWGASACPNCGSANISMVK